MVNICPSCERPLYAAVGCKGCGKRFCLFCLPQPMKGYCELCGDFNDEFFNGLGVA